MSMRRWSTPRLLAHALALAVLLAVFGLYLRPEFMVQVAQMVWSCF